MGGTVAIRSVNYNFSGELQFRSYFRVIMELSRKSDKIIILILYIDNSISKTLFVFMLHSCI